MMPLNTAASVSQTLMIALVKEQSGRRIEQARKREGITQRQLAHDLGMGIRWLREIESGNPASRLDDHLQCAFQLGLSVGHILIPLLFYGHHMDFPQQLTTGDLHDIERQCIDLIAERNIRQITSALTPKWWGSRTPAVVSGL
jgi:transcriptional regulator with XRE-family HTH domain